MDGGIFDGQDPAKLYMPKWEHRGKFTIDTRTLIGVFDSSIDGLTVVRELICQIPDERMVYFDDTARLLYGAKSRDTIICPSRQIVRSPKTKGVKVIVIVCNTASSHALKTLAEGNEIPVVGVIYTGTLSAVRATRNGRIDVIGTRGTANSEIYLKVIQSISPGTRVSQEICPMSVPLVKEGLLHDNVTDEVAARYLQELKEKYIDTLVLGCTHYPLLRSAIGHIVGEEMTFVNPAYETTTELRNILAREKLLDPGDRNMEGKHRFYMNSLVENFRDSVNSILSVEHLKAKKIRIEKY